MSEGLDKINKYLNKGSFFELKNEDGIVDKFILPMIPTELCGEYWEVMTRIQGVSEENFLEKVDKDTFNLIIKLAVASLESSPDFSGVDETTLKNFVTQNITPIMTKMFEINNFGATRVSDREAIDRAKAIRSLKESQNAKGNAEGT